MQRATPDMRFDDSKGQYTLLSPDLVSGFFVLENIQNLKDKNATERNKSIDKKQWR